MLQLPGFRKLPAIGGVHLAQALRLHAMGFLNGHRFNDLYSRDHRS